MKNITQKQPVAVVTVAVVGILEIINGVALALGWWSTETGVGAAVALVVGGALELKETWPRVFSPATHEAEVEEARQDAAGGFRPPYGG